MRCAAILMKSVESAPVSNQSEVSAPVASAQRVALGSQISAVLKDGVAFSDLRSAAMELGITATRSADGSVKSTNPVCRSVFCVLLASYAGKQGITRGQLIELAGLSRTINVDGSKSEAAGALYLADGKVNGDRASLGTVKIRPAGKSGNVSWNG